MDLSAIFFVLAVLILVGMYLYAPFSGRGDRAIGEEDHEISSLLAERDRVVNALQELDFDYRLGKIPDQEYPSQRAGLLQSGATILRRLDELQPALSSARDAEARLESAVAARRADAAAQRPDLTDDDLESMIAARRRQRSDKSAGFCPRCGQPVLVSDRFCPACGKSLS